MVAPNFPRSSEQYSLYRAVLDAADDKPVTFRTLDIGGDKVLPYMRNIEEENPALGWRAIRLGLDRPALLRTQLRALLRAAGGRSLKIMFPMIAAVSEFEQAKELVERELTHLRRHGHKLPDQVEVGSMVEVPSLLYQLDELLEHADFLSVGSNDLVQFLYAIDRGNPRVSNRFDALSAPVLHALEGHRRQMPRARQAGNGLRRACLAADRRAGPGRHRLPLAVADAVGGRSDQGDAARPRQPQGRRVSLPADREAGPRHVDSRAARKIRGDGIPPDLGEPVAPGRHWACPGGGAIVVASIRHNGRFGAA